MSATIPIKFVVQQLDHPVEEHVFEQEMISVGRGRPGKEKKGVDLQLKDPDVARVHCAVHIRNLDDVFVMPMGTAATYVGGNKVKLKEKLASGMVIEIGTSQITVYVGEDAMKSHLPSPTLPASVGSSSLPTGSIHPDLSVGSQEEFSIQSGEYEVMSGQSLSIQSHMASDSVVSEGDATPTGNIGFMPSAMDSTPQSPAVDVSGYVLYPMHTEPEGTFGPMGPTPMPLPERYPPSSLPLLLDVADRLNKEVWFREEKIL